MWLTDQVAGSENQADRLERCVDIEQALALVRSLMDRLAGELAEQAGSVDAPRRRRLLQALALPRHAATIRDLSFALRELIALEHELYSPGGRRYAKLRETLLALAAGAVSCGHGPELDHPSMTTCSTDGGS